MAAIWLAVGRTARRIRRSEVIVRVRDEGTGIAADMVPEVFTFFTPGRASPHRTRADLASDWRSSAASSIFIAAA